MIKSGKDKDRMISDLKVMSILIIFLLQIVHTNALGNKL